MIDDLKPLIGKLTNFAKARLGFEDPPRLFLKKDQKNSTEMLGKTAHYDPYKKEITIFVTGRHPKDILRSYCHELVHHCQNARGDLTPEKMKTLSPRYAQENDHMRKMEEEAYLQGNMCFRDWEDGLDNKSSFIMSLAEQRFIKENKAMSVKKITKGDLKNLISKLLKEETSIEVEEDDDKGSIVITNADGTDLEMEDEEETTNESTRSKPDRLAQQHLKRSIERAKASKNRGGDMDDAFQAEIDKLKDASVEIPKAHKDKLKKIFGLNTDENEMSDKEAKEYSNLISKVADQDKKAKEKKKDSDKEPVTEQWDADGDGFDDGIGPGHFFKNYSPEQKAKLERCVEITKAEVVAPNAGAYFIEDMTPEDFARSKCAESFPPDLDDPRQPKGEGPELYEKTSKIKTPEQENRIYESRFNDRNTKIFNKLLKKWTK